MLRSPAASSGQQARKGGEDGTSESENNPPGREQRFYLPSQSSVNAETFAYLRTRPSMAYDAPSDDRNPEISTLVSRIRVGVIQPLYHTKSKQ